ncbi:MAG: histidine kinase [Caldilinea sp.]
MDQEWLASVLCMVNRSMLREARLHAEVDRLVRDRSLHLRRMMEIQEECRRRVARDLHDEVSQSLTAALVQLDTVEALLYQQPDRAATQIGGLRTTLGRLHDEVQRVLLDLRPVLLEQKGLMAALAWYGNERLRPLGCTVHLSGGRCAPDLPEEVKLTLYRIGQESLSNVARHAAAQNVWLDLHCTGAD